MQKELHTAKPRRWIGLLALAASAILGWGLRGAAQAPLPPPPPGPELVPPAPPSPSGSAPTEKAEPSKIVVEQLTAPPLEKRPAHPTTTPVGSKEVGVPGQPPTGFPNVAPNSGGVNPPGEVAVPTNPAKSAVPSTPAPPQPLSPAVRSPESSGRPISGEEGGVTKPVPPTPPTPVTLQKPAPAILIIELPAQATLWIEDQKMSQTGPVRSFQSPPLQPGKTYLYKIRLSWPGPNGQPITTEHEITVQAGQTQRIDFRPLAQSLGGNEPPTIAPLTPNPPPVPPSPPRRLFPFLRPEGSGSQ